LLQMHLASTRCYAGKAMSPRNAEQALTRWRALIFSLDFCQSGRG
jgi:hypothetical protein